MIKKIVTLGFVDDFLRGLNLQAIRLHQFLLQEEPDKRMLVFYSLGFLSDSYAQNSEQLLKEGRNYEAGFFAGKASEIRQVCRGVFGMVPEFDYRTSMYKVPRNVVTNISPDQLQEMAQFCVQNMQSDKAALEDNKLLAHVIVEGFKKHKTKPIGIMNTYIEAVKTYYKKNREKPDKWPVAYELLLVLDNVETVISELKKTAKQKERKGLEGFKVSL